MDNFFTYLDGEGGLWKKVFVGRVGVISGFISIPLLSFLLVRLYGLVLGLRLVF
jgi:hypothetical protein